MVTLLFFLISRMSPQNNFQSSEKSRNKPTVKFQPQSTIRPFNDDENLVEIFSI